MPEGLRRAQVLFYMPTATPLLRPSGELVAGGAEKQVLMLARGLARRGHEVGIVVFADGGEVAARVGDVEVIVQRLPRIRLPLLRTLVHYARTLAMLMSSPARVLVYRAATTHTLLVALAARLRRRRFVYCSAGELDFDYAAWQPRRLFVWMFSLGVRLADEIVVQTDNQVALSRERFGREPVLIRSLAEPAPGPPPAVGPSEAFLWLGTLNGYKQPHAYLALARAVPEARFRMVAVVRGAGEDRAAEELRRASSELPNLELLEPRPRAELVPLLDRSVALVSTSVTEGMPNVFLEAWGRGVPVLSLNVDPDGLIEREGLGACAGGDLGRLSELARAMWTRRGDRDGLGERCRDYVMREHSTDEIVERWAQVLRLESG